MALAASRADSFNMPIQTASAFVDYVCCWSDAELIFLHYSSRMRAALSLSTCEVEAVLVQAYLPPL
jgi:hypothetical protein